MVGQGQVRRQPNGFGVGGLGWVPLAEVVQDVAEVQMEAGVVWLKAHRLAAVGQGLVQVAHLQEQLAEVPVRRRQARVEFRRPAELGERLRAPGAPLQGCRQRVVRPGPVGWSRRACRKDSAAATAFPWPSKTKPRVS